MVSESGAALLDPSAKAALIERILPRATVVTPNLPEARALSGLGDAASPERARRGGARARARMPWSSPAATPRTGATCSSTAAASLSIEGPRYPDGAAPRLRLHPLLGALCAFLARGYELAEAARWAKEIAAEAVGNGLRGIGAGAGHRSTLCGIEPRDNRQR